MFGKRLITLDKRETTFSDHYPVESVVKPSPRQVKQPQHPEGGMQPEEKLSVYDAVCMYSKNVPYANGEQDLMGTIEAGKFADMVVIDRDIFNIPDDELKDVQALYTYMAGCQTYCRG